MRHVLLVPLAAFALLGACDAGTSAPAEKAAPLLSDLQIVPGDYTCEEPAWTLPACATGTTQQPPLRPALHVSLPTPITYTDTPPTSGTHRPDWARWGEYQFLPPQNWVHNLEHGGVALLYHPCTPPEVVAQLRQYAKARLPDDSGPFRWVLTPYPGLPHPVMAVTWGWSYAATCVQPSELDAFLLLHYRKAPEDFGTPGEYGKGWLP